MAYPSTSVLQFDEEYYWELVTFRVEGRLFRVPKHMFIEHSKPFSLKYLVGSDCSSKPEGPESDEPLTRAIPLDVSAEEFRCLLKVLYPRHVMSKGLPKNEWLSVLKLSHEWSFLSYRQMAVEALIPVTDPFEKIRLGKQYSVAALVKLGLVELVTRAEGISQDEAEKIGWRNAIDLFNIREAYLTSSASPDDSEQPFDVEAAVREVFDSDLTAVSDNESVYLDWAKGNEVDEVKLRAAELEEHIRQQEQLLAQGKTALKALKEELASAAGTKPPLLIETTSRLAITCPSSALESAPVQVVYPAIKLEKDKEEKSPQPKGEEEPDPSPDVTQPTPSASSGKQEIQPIAHTQPNAGSGFPPNKSLFVRHFPPPSSNAATPAVAPIHSPGNPTTASGKSPAVTSGAEQAPVASVAHSHLTVVQPSAA